MNIHDSVPELRERGVRERLREEVSGVGSGAHERDNEPSLFDTFPHEEVSASDMLHPTEVLGVISNIYGAFVVTG